jgi:hypothetical protein
MEIIKQPKIKNNNCIQKQIPPENAIVQSPNKIDMNRRIANAFAKWAEGDVYCYDYKINLFSRDCHGNFYPITINSEDVLTLNIYEEFNDRLVYTQKYTNIKENILPINIDEETTKLFKKGYYKVEVILDGNVNHYMVPEITDFKDIECFTNNELLINNGYFVVGDYLSIEHITEDSEDEEILDNTDYYCISGVMPLVTEEIRRAYNLSSQYVIPLQALNFEDYAEQTCRVQIFYTDGTIVKNNTQKINKDGTIDILLDENCISRFDGCIKIDIGEIEKIYNYKISDDILIQSQVINPQISVDDKRINITCGISYKNDETNIIYFRGICIGNLPFSIVFSNSQYLGATGKLAYQQGNDVGVVGFQVDKKQPICQINIPINYLNRTKPININIQVNDLDLQLEQEYTLDISDISTPDEYTENAYPIPSCLYIDRCCFNNKYKICSICTIRKNSLIYVPFRKQIIDENNSLVVVY